MKTHEILDVLQQNKIPVRNDLPEKLHIYLNLLLEWNKNMDLTAVITEREVLEKHFLDSLSVLRYGFIREETNMIDVGTGAGFPGLVLAMARPDLEVTLLDSQKKRLLFLERVIDETGTGNVTIIHSRAEDGARRKELRGQFDYATARALAPLNILCEYLLPFVKLNGYALCWKGPAINEEMASGTKAAHILGGRIEMPVVCSVEGQNWSHIILPIKKLHSTPGTYPRKAGTPKNKPLGT